MKSVHLIRHAKSSWDHPGLADRARPLSQRGHRDTRIMAHAMHEAGVVFDHVLCSVAQRAQLTIQGVAEHWPGRPIDWQLHESLYTFSASAIWSLVRALTDDQQVVFLVGHNPAFTDFVNQASAAGLANVPTCAYAHVSFTQATQWQEVVAGTAELAAFMKPKMFK
ncbi:SixA phosphatase family protein [Marinicella meishanensis]|uniref:SixA phosphatase family protein n=1 Tax=Marinicella meishanensis TaxID=2873263 RepID=UPI001CBBF6F5|nr:histidine phosphatase family protein [Marinicella sp. NBU2979]